MVYKGTSTKKYRLLTIAFEFIAERNKERKSKYQMEDKHYLFQIKNYLDSKGVKNNEGFLTLARERKVGRRFSLSDHIRGMIHSMLSNQTKWKRIEPHLDEIDSLFFMYNAEQILKTPPDYFSRGIFSLKCGNVSTKKQMDSLNYNISLMKNIEEKHGGIDSFVTSLPAYEIVKIFSDPNSDYKLRLFGEPLVWEYLRNVGIEGAKPDIHLRRFFGSDRMAKSKSSPASINDVLCEIEYLSKETGFTQTEIDDLIWRYCADGYGEICTKNPNCQGCVIRYKCSRGELGTDVR